MLADPNAGRIAVIVNEFGALGIDGRLVVGAHDEVIELRNGCVCCELREDLRRTVTGLLARRARWLLPLRFDRILVETSGLASPGPMLQTFLLDPGLAASTRVDGVIALAHAGHIVEQLAGFSEAGVQLACADRVLLNHGDHAAPGAEAAVRAAAPLATIQRCVRAEVEIPPLLDVGTADPSRWRLQEVAHTPGVTTVALRGGELDLPKIKMFLQFAAARRTWEILRIKGILRCRDVAAPVVVHGVHQWLEIGPGAGSRPEASALVVIGRGLDPGELERGWAAAGGDPRGAPR